MNVVKVIIEPRPEASIMAATEPEAAPDDVMASLLAKSEHCVVHLCGCSCDC